MSQILRQKSRLKRPKSFDDGHALTPTLAGKRLLAEALVAIGKHENRLFRDIEPDTVSRILAAMKAIREAR